MQTVWSRVAQTRCLCNCPTCVSATGVVARRTTTATARRKIRAGDVFTVFASSLAATATLFDSTKKDARRTHWDKIIDDARAQVQATEAQQQTRLASLAHASGGEVREGHDARRMTTVAGSTRRVIGPRCSNDEWKRAKADTWDKVFDWAEKQDATRAASGFQDWKGVSLGLLQSLSPIQLQELLANDALLRRFYGGPSSATLVDETSKDNLSAKKLKTLEYSVAKLVLSLLADPSTAPREAESGEGTPSNHKRTEGAASCRHRDQRELNTSVAKKSGPILNRHGASSNVQESVLEKNMSERMISHEGNVHQRLHEIDSKIRLFTRKGGYNKSTLLEAVGSLSAPSYHGTDGDEAKALNNALRKILDQTSCEQDSRPSVTKICYNLLASKTPPNIHSYNMLLMQFCRLDRPHWVKAVWVSMRESHIRPNEITHSTLLRYYTVTNNAPAFTSYLLLMSGHNGGLALAAFDQSISPIARNRYRFFGKRHGKAAEKARKNGEVYESLIVGALRFFGAQTAMQHYREMIDDGWKSSIGLLTAILNHCYHRRDWEAGVSVWHRIGETAEGGRLNAYKWMLCLCQACGKETLFKRILQEGVDQGVIPASMLEMMDSAKPEDIMGHFEDVKPSTSRTQNGAEVIAAPALWASTSDIDVASPLAVSEAVQSSKSTSPEQQITYTHSKRHRLEQQLEVLSASISDTVKNGTSGSTLPKPATPVNDDLVVGLSKKVRKFNQEDAHKMDGQEYQHYQYLPPGQPHNSGQVISRTLYEEYKRDVIARLESEERPSGTVHLDGDSSRRNDRETYDIGDGRPVPQPRDNPLMPTPPNFPHPVTWTDSDKQPARSSAR